VIYNYYFNKFAYISEMLLMKYSRVAGVIMFFQLVY